jgi:hypothetical protein
LFIEFYTCYFDTSLDSVIGHGGGYSEREKVTSASMTTFTYSIHTSLKAKLQYLAFRYFYIEGYCVSHWGEEQRLDRVVMLQFGSEPKFKPEPWQT